MRRAWVWPRDQLITFWWRSASLSGSGKNWRSAEVCAVWVLLVLVLVFVLLLDLLLNLQFTVDVHSSRTWSVNICTCFFSDNGHFSHSSFEFRPYSRHVVTWKQDLWYKLHVLRWRLTASVVTADNDGSYMPNITYGGCGWLYNDGRQSQPLANVAA